MSNQGFRDPMPWSPDQKYSFPERSLPDLIRSIAVYNACSYSWLANITPSILKSAAKYHLDRPLYSIIKSTLFKQFCGGENPTEVRAVADRLQQNGVGVILDYAAEPDLCPSSASNPNSLVPGTSYYDNSRDNICKAILVCKSSDRPFVAVKLTSLFDSEYLQSYSSGSKEPQTNGDASPELRNQFTEGWDRLKSICDLAKREGVRLAIDAEQSFVQDAIDDIALQAMRLYNPVLGTKEPLVVNTYQMYRTDGLNRLKSQLVESEKCGFHFGAKIVRGAYFIGERIWATERKITCPIVNSANEAHFNYDEAVRSVFSYVKNLPSLDQRKFLFIFATHNSESIQKATELCREHVALGHRMQIDFAQLYGMCDSLSFSLNAAGYPVYKYIPYGPVKEVIPYLIRRSQENSSVFRLAQSDASQMWNELKGRIFHK